MNDFLSPGWIEALAAKFAAAETGSSATPLTIQYLVRGDDDEVVAYHLRLGPDHDVAQAGAVEAPDVTFRMDRETAQAISDGSLSSEEAFITGRLDLEGDTEALIQAHRDGLSPDA